MKAEMTIVDYATYHSGIPPYCVDISDIPAELMSEAIAADDGMIKDRAQGGQVLAHWYTLLENLGIDADYVERDDLGFRAYLDEESAAEYAVQVIERR